MGIRLWVCPETDLPPGWKGDDCIYSGWNGYFFMERKKIIALVSLIVISLAILSLVPEYNNEYLTSIYPAAKIVETSFDKNLNSRNCFAEYTYSVQDGNKDFDCYFIKSLGYKDFIYYMVEIDNINVRIENVRLIDEHETEDYGGYIREGWFLERFKNMPLSHPSEIVKIHQEKNYEIVAITGATITSQSASEAVNLAIEIHKMKAAKSQ
jgi:Na+-translocating ferredoxin:NAD+ oxidoreductase RnfG subunit